MSFFDTIPDRSNDQAVTVSWWNTIKTHLIDFTASGVVEDLTITGTLTAPNFNINPASSVVINNNQSSSLDITGMVLDHTEYTSAIIRCSIDRRTDLENRFSTFIIVCHYVGGFWRYTIRDYDIIEGGLDGVTLSLAIDQFRYTSDDMSNGTYDNINSNIIFRIEPLI